MVPRFCVALLLFRQRSDFFYAQISEHPPKRIKKKENITGYLKRYAAQVSSADQGAIINR